MEKIIFKQPAIIQDIIQQQSISSSSSVVKRKRSKKPSIEKKIKKSYCYSNCANKCDVCDIEIESKMRLGSKNIFICSNCSKKFNRCITKMIFEWPYFNKMLSFIDLERMEPFFFNKPKKRILKPIHENIYLECYWCKLIVKNSLQLFDSCDTSCLSSLSSNNASTKHFWIPKQQQSCVTTKRIQKIDSDTTSCDDPTTKKIQKIDTNDDDDDSCVEMKPTPTKKRIQKIDSDTNDDDSCVKMNPTKKRIRKIDDSCDDENQIK